LLLSVLLGEIYACFGLNYGCGLIDSLVTDVIVPAILVAT
jgi:hypothetical protein